MIQNQGTTTTNSYYQERFRPHIHFTPEKMWMNDPNGLVYYKGEYHLFYQYHPDSKKWGPMHWGHAVSKDLLTWEHLPIALYPDELGMVFSGSVVVDWDDTTGFFDGKEGLVAIFTHADGDLQRQSIAYSKDQGRSWEKYAGNPVIKNPGIQDFRDPKVIWHEETAKWVMVLAAGRKVQFYTSPDLKQWTFVSEFGEGWGAREGIWECPDIFPLKNEKTGEKKWVLPIGIDAGGPAGGSGTQYFIGSFDGKTFTPEQSKQEVRWLDYGKDFYASQSFSNVPGDRRVVIAWMNNWQYANEVPTDPWRSAMSLPRELNLITVDGEECVIQKPVHELESLRNSKPASETFTVNSSEKITKRQPSLPFVLEMKVEAGSSQRLEGRVFVTGDDPGFLFGIDFSKDVLYVRRGYTEEGFSKYYNGTFEAPLRKGRSDYQLTVICDYSSVEIFTDDGKVALTNLHLPSEAISYEIVMEAVGGTADVSDYKVSELSPRWQQANR
ncbi:glycoside hydrolase family 32 protein [Thalassobacillus sp. B23F22_16]|uniref:glycoside hydrolase family 32 protein n=1 Tax=Thalassobacillus sp. B23F22_16 TaxID=3459513 RepID=UPI00373F82AA